MTYQEEAHLKKKSSLHRPKDDDSDVCNNNIGSKSS